MKICLAASFLLGATLLFSSPVAHAQASAPDFPAAGTPARSSAASLINPDRARRQQQMSPEDAARDQQLQILEARTGNTSFGTERGGPYRQLDKGGNAFTLRKFKAMPGQEQKRGMSKRVVMGANPKGKPLVHDHSRKKRFLFF